MATPPPKKKEMKAFDGFFHSHFHSSLVRGFNIEGYAAPPTGGRVKMLPLNGLQDRSHPPRSRALFRILPLLGASLTLQQFSEPFAVGAI